MRKRRKNKVKKKAATEEGESSHTQTYSLIAILLSIICVNQSLLNESNIQYKVCELL